MRTWADHQGSRLMVISVITLFSVLAISLVVSNTAEAKRKNCGTYKAGGVKYKLVVRRGKVKCSSARAAIRSGLKRKNCGRPSQRTCNATGNWQCQYSYQGEYEKVKGQFYCFVPKKVRGQTSPVDFWKPGKYSKIVVLEDR